MKSRMDLKTMLVSALSGLLPGCVDAPQTGDGGSGGEASQTDGPTSETSGGSTSAGSQSATGEEGESSTGGENELACAWLAGTLDDVGTAPQGSLSTAIATCDLDAEAGPVARLRLANADAASCTEPTAQPACSEGYTAIWIDLPPSYQTVGAHDLSELDSWGDLQGGGSNDDDCGGYVGGSPYSGTLNITDVSATAVEGHVFADMGDELYVSGSFRAEFCP